MYDDILKIVLWCDDWGIAIGFRISWPRFVLFILKLKGMFCADKNLQGVNCNVMYCTKQVLLALCVCSSFRN